MKPLSWDEKTPRTPAQQLEQPPKRSESAEVEHLEGGGGVSQKLNSSAHNRRKKGPRPFFDPFISAQW